MNKDDKKKKKKKLTGTGVLSIFSVAAQLMLALFCVIIISLMISL